MERLRLFTLYSVGFAFLLILNAPSSCISQIYAYYESPQTVVDCYATQPCLHPIVQVKDPNPTTLEELHGPSRQVLIELSQFAKVYGDGNLSSSSSDYLLSKFNPAFLYNYTIELVLSSFHLIASNLYRCIVEIQLCSSSTLRLLSQFPSIHNSLYLAVTSCSKYFGNAMESSTIIDVLCLLRNTKIQLLSKYHRISGVYHEMISRILQYVSIQYPSLPHGIANISRISTNLIRAPTPNSMHIPKSMLAVANTFPSKYSQDIECFVGFIKAYLTSSTTWATIITTLIINCLTITFIHLYIYPGTSTASNNTSVHNSQNKASIPSVVPEIETKNIHELAEASIAITELLGAIRNGSIRSFAYSTRRRCRSCLARRVQIYE